MGFFEAVSVCLSKFFSPYGRASRSEYWWYVLFVFILSFIVGCVGGIYSVGPFTRFSPVNTLVDLFSLVFSISLFIAGIRRMHDIGKSGWNMCWNLIPIVGQIYVLVLLCQPSAHYTNDYN